MGIIKGFFKYTFYPYWRLGKDVSGGVKRFSAALNAARTASRDAGRTEATVALPADVHERFAFLAVKRGFSEADIRNQLIASRRGKRAALFWFLTMLVSALLAPVYVHGLPGFFSILITLLGLYFSGIKTLQYGKYQAQLEDRALYSFHEFMSRPDLFSFLLLR